MPNGPFSTGEGGQAPQRRTLGPQIPQQPGTVFIPGRSFGPGVPSAHHLPQYSSEPAGFSGQQSSVGSNMGQEMPAIIQNTINQFLASPSRDLRQYLELQSTEENLDNFMLTMPASPTLQNHLPRFPEVSTGEEMSYAFERRYESFEISPDAETVGLLGLSELGGLISFGKSLLCVFFRAAEDILDYIPAGSLLAHYSSILSSLKELTINEYYSLSSNLLYRYTSYNNLNYLETEIEILSVTSSLIEFAFKYLEDCDLLHLDILTGIPLCIREKPGFLQAKIVDLSKSEEELINQINDLKKKGVTFSPAPGSITERGSIFSEGRRQREYIGKKGKNPQNKEVDETSRERGWLQGEWLDLDQARGTRTITQDKIDSGTDKTPINKDTGKPFPVSPLSRISGSEQIRVGEKATVGGKSQSVVVSGRATKYAEYDQTRGQYDSCGFSSKCSHWHLHPDALPKDTPGPKPTPSHPSTGDLGVLLRNTDRINESLEPRDPDTAYIGVFDGWFIIKRNQEKIPNVIIDAIVKKINNLQSMGLKEKDEVQQAWNTLVKALKEVGIGVYREVNPDSSEESKGQIPFETWDGSGANWFN